MPTPDIDTALADAAAGMLFRSETADPFAAVRFTHAQLPDPTPDALRAAVGRAADARVEEVTLEDLFRNVSVAESWQDEEVRAEVPRYQNLMRVLRERLTDVRVFRVGRTEIDVLILGRTPGGEWAGYRTLVVET